MGTLNLNESSVVFQTTPTTLSSTEPVRTLTSPPCWFRLVLRSLFDCHSSTLKPPFSSTLSIPVVQCEQNPVYHPCNCCSSMFSLCEGSGFLLLPFFSTLFLPWREPACLWMSVQSSHRCLALDLSSFPSTESNVHAHLLMVLGFCGTSWKYLHW